MLNNLPLDVLSVVSEAEKNLCNEKAANCEIYELVLWCNPMNYFGG